ncbi:hypothetical protein EGI22_11915 [Lacihabitans sp. LS3-19]|uniref:hypothetical protein n=1 Tax=Lacihabitans sp. LS3-19 TaxID=2487335 RepID=UPI0020CC7251|nr:hypothetical protein [Lacihabitans sp. LS3-19]MCP9768622.1 hypothetical protein [Lacihabitans sp. LS3-19]
MEKQQIIEEIISEILDSDIIFFAIGGFGKYLYDDKIDIKDLDFYIPAELNNSEKLIGLILKFDRRNKLNNYIFDKIIRINYKSLTIDLLPKIDGVNFESVMENYEIKYFNNLPIRTLSQNKIEENINFIKNQIE